MYYYYQWICAALPCAMNQQCCTVPLTTQFQLAVNLFSLFLNSKTFNVNPNFKKEEKPQSQIKLQTEYVLIRLKKKNKSLNSL